MSDSDKSAKAAAAKATNGAEGETIALSMLPPVSARFAPEPVAEAPASPALPLDVAALPDDVLDALLAAAQSERAQRRAKKRAEMLASFGTRIAAFLAEAHAAGLDDTDLETVLPKRLRGSKRASARTGTAEDDGRRTVPYKYRNPENPAQKWTGRGIAPSWIAFSDETLPPLKKDGKPRRVPLPKYRIPDSY